MEDFIDTVPEQRLQNRLWGAIRGRGAFRRFKDVLLDHAEERERWFQFRDGRLRERVMRWLRDEGIEPSPGHLARGGAGCRLEACAPKDSPSALAVT